MFQYDLYRRIAEILSPNHTDELFDYIIHSMDDNIGFLRSRYCYWDKTTRNSELKHELKKIIIATESPFDFENDTNYYCENPFGIADMKYTLLKMQIWYWYDIKDEEQFQEERQHNACLGYLYAIKIDLESGTYQKYDKFSMNI